MSLDIVKVGPSNGRKSTRPLKSGSVEGGCWLDVGEGTTLINSVDSGVWVKLKREGGGG